LRQEYLPCHYLTTGLILTNTGLYFRTFPTGTE
jgi:hypothetical protein